MNPGRYEFETLLLRELAQKAQAAHDAGLIDARNDYCWRHDELALARLRRQEITERR